MPGHRGRGEPAVAERDPDPVVTEAALQQAGARPLRQRCQVYRSQGRALAAGCSDRPGLHRTEQPLAERLRRELQRQAARRAAESEWFRSRAEVKGLIGRWRQFYNEQRPHSAHGYKPPATIRRNWSEPDTIHPELTACLATSSIPRSRCALHHILGSEPECESDRIHEQKSVVSGCVPVARLGQV
jgi:hypothetical protein